MLHFIVRDVLHCAQTSTLFINMGVAEENCKPFHRGLDINHKEDLKSPLNKFG